MKGSLDFSWSILFTTIELLDTPTVSNRLMSFDLLTKRMPCCPLKCCFIAAITTLLHWAGEGPLTLTIISLYAEFSFTFLNLLKWISNFHVNDSITDSTEIFTADTQMEWMNFSIPLYNFLSLRKNNLISSLLSKSSFFLFLTTCSSRTRNSSN